MGAPASSSAPFLPLLCDRVSGIAETAEKEDVAI